MKRAKVESSNVAAVGFDAVSSTLEVEFHNGSVYQYPGVTSDEHTALMGAKSVGKHFAQHFRGRSCTRVKERS